MRHHEYMIDERLLTSNSCKTPIVNSNPIFNYDPVSGLAILSTNVSICPSPLAHVQCVIRPKLPESHWPAYPSTKSRDCSDTLEQPKTFRQHNVFPPPLIKNSPRPQDTTDRQNNVIPLLFPLPLTRPPPCPLLLLRRRLLWARNSRESEPSRPVHTHGGQRCRLGVRHVCQAASNGTYSPLVYS
jgi:hypothetical protein